MMNLANALISTTDSVYPYEMWTIRVSEEVSDRIADGIVAAAESLLDLDQGFVSDHHPAAGGALAAYKAGWLVPVKHDHTGVWYVPAKDKVALVKW